MNLKACSTLAALIVSGCLGAKAENTSAIPPRSIPTFPTSNIARQGHFYVGGHYLGESGKETMNGAMYVEVWVPKQIRHRYPMVFITGGGGQGAYSLLQTPDGRPGWAYDFVNQGYTVYMMDYPGEGRSANFPGVDGALLPPRSGPLMEEIWTGGRPPATPQSIRIVQQRVRDEICQNQTAFRRLCAHGYSERNGKKGSEETHLPSSIQFSTQL